MSSGKSSSSSSSATTSNSEDNRVVADNGAIALAKDAIYNYSPSVVNELSPNMLTALGQFVGLVRDAGTVVVDTADKANQSAQASIAAVTSAIQNDKLGTSTSEQTLMKYIPLMIGAAVVIFVLIMIFRKKG